jgi:TRAP-type C4-dicarboxylate transport system permease small subunit
MGFRFDSTQRRKKNARGPVSGIGMILIFIVLGFSIWLGWWLPKNVNLRGYVPIPDNWNLLTQQIVVGVVAFILLQFLVVLIQGILFPLQPQDKYDEDGLYKRD